MLCASNLYTRGTARNGVSPVSLAAEPIDVGGNHFFLYGTLLSLPSIISRYIQLFVQKWSFYLKNFLVWPACKVLALLTNGKDP